MAKRGGGRRVASSGGEVYGSAWRTKLSTRILSCVVSVALVFMVPLPAFAEQANANTQNGTAAAAATEQAAAAAETAATEQAAVQAAATEAAASVEAAETAETQEAQAAAGTAAGTETAAGTAAGTETAAGTAAAAGEAEPNSGSSSGGSTKGGVVKSVMTVVKGALQLTQAILVEYDARHTQSAIDIGTDGETGYYYIDEWTFKNVDEITGEETANWTPDIPCGLIVHGTVYLVIKDGVEVTINYEDSQTAQSAGILVNGSGNALYITTGNNSDDPTVDPETVEVKGTGKISVYGGKECAAIGGQREGDRSTGENIHILSGKVYAYGGEHGAGIGGSCHGASRGITIENDIDNPELQPYVYAQGGLMAAGIGSGKGGGSVTSPSMGFYQWDGNVSGGCDITIKAGEVYAQGGGAAAGIGGGLDADGHMIVIEGTAKVTAVGGEKADFADCGGAGIGCGDNYLCTCRAYNIHIGGDAEVTAIGAEHCAGIGSVDNERAFGILIDGNAKVNATAGAKAAAIGGGRNGYADYIEICGDCVVWANIDSNGNPCATEKQTGIGAGANRKACTDGPIKIFGHATVRASGNGGAAIGGGDSYGTDGVINLYEYCDVEAWQLGAGAAIGAGRNGHTYDYVRIGYSDNGADTTGDVAGACRVLAHAQSGEKGAAIGSAKNNMSTGHVTIAGQCYITGTKADGTVTTSYGSNWDWKTARNYCDIQCEGYSGQTDPKLHVKQTSEGDWPTVGYESTVSYEVSAEYISLNSTGFDVKWYADAAGTQETSAPAYVQAVKSGIDLDIYTCPDSSLQNSDWGITPAGTYYFRVCATQNGEQILSDEVCEYTIQKQHVTVTSGSQTWIANGTSHSCETWTQEPAVIACKTSNQSGSPAYTMTDEYLGFSVIESCTDFATITEVGTVENTFDCKVKDTYAALGYVAEKVYGTLQVVDAPYVIQGGDYFGKYDGEAHGLKAKLIGLSGVDLTGYATVTYETSTDGETWTPTGNQGKDAPSITDVGILYVRVTAVIGTGAVKTATYTMEVSPRNVTLSSTSASKSYDAVALTADDPEDDIAVSGDGFAGSEGVDVTFKDTSSITKVGTVSNDFTYAAEKGTNLDNYVITAVPGTLEVTKAAGIVTLNTANASKAYDGTALTAEEYGKVGEIFTDNGDVLQVVFDYNTSMPSDSAAVNAGTYGNSIQYKVLNGADDRTDCYNFNDVVEGTLTIMPAEVTLVSDDLVAVKSDTTAEAYAPNITPTVNGEAKAKASGEGTAITLVNNEQIACTGFPRVETTYESVNNTFEYAGVEDTGFVADNYNITRLYGSLLLVDEMTVTGSDRVCVYDGKKHEAPATVTETEQDATTELTYATRTTAGGTWSEYTTEVPSLTDAGTLYIKAKAVKGVQVKEAEYTLIVQPRPVTLSSESATKAYDGTALTASAEPTVVSGSWINGHTPKAIAATGTQTYAGSSENTIEVMFANATDEANYSITRQCGTLTVVQNAQFISVSTASATQAYNGMALTNRNWTGTWHDANGTKVELGTGKANTLSNGDVLSVIPTGSVTNVGSAQNTCNIRVMNGDDDVTANYVFDEPELGTLQVVPRTVSISTASASKVYDGTELTADETGQTAGAALDYKIEGDGFIAGQGVTVQITGSRTDAGTSANTAIYALNAGTDAANYSITVNPGTLTVNKRKVTVTSGSKIEEQTSEGQEVTCSDVTVSGDGFANAGGVAECTATATGKQTEVTTSTADVKAADNTVAYAWVEGATSDNYEITENLGKLVLVSSNVTCLVVTDYEGIYDGAAHGAAFDLHRGTDLSGTVTKTYSTDGGSSWKAFSDPNELPTFKDVNTADSSYAYTVKVKVTDGSVEATGEYRVTILPRELTLTAGSQSWVYDGEAHSCNEVTIGGYGFASETEQADAAVTAEGIVTDVQVDGQGAVVSVPNIVSGATEKSGSFDPGNYTITKTVGELTVTKRPVILVSKALGVTPEEDNPYTQAYAEAYEQAASLAELPTVELTEQLYDGKAHAKQEVVEVGNPDHGGLQRIDGMGFVGEDKAVYTFASAETGGYTDAGTYFNEFEYELSENAKESNYDIRTLYGLITITPRTVSFVSDSASKMYDGEALTCEKMTVGGDGFVQGEGDIFTFTGTQTQVGTSENTFVYAFDEKTKAKNYTVSSETYGTLEVVTNDTLRIEVPADAEYAYDGKPHGEAAKASVGGAPSDIPVLYSTDGGLTFTEDVAQQTDPGTIEVKVRAWADGYKAATGSYRITVNAVDATELAGAGRYETCAKIVAEAYPEGADGVIVCTGENFPDALASASLAGALDWPIVIVPGSELGAFAGETIEGLNAEEAIVVGGESAVSEAVFTELQGMFGAKNVCRVAGENRRATADAIYSKGNELGIEWSDTAILATAENFADALSFSNHSAKSKSPIFLVAEDGELTAGTQYALASGGFDKVYVLGGEAAIPTSVERWLYENAPEASAERLGGSDRYVTSKLIVEAYIKLNGGASGACVATGEKFPDALVGSVLAAKSDCVMALAKDTNIVSFVPLRNYVAETGNALPRLYVLGGEAAVSSAVRAAAKAAVFGVTEEL